MTTVITAQPQGVDHNQGQFRILYDNLFDKATSVIASSEDPDFPVENVYDWLPNDYFLPAASGAYTITCTFANTQTANCMAFYKQDLHSNGGSIQLQYWDGAAWQNATDIITPSSDAPRIVYFDAQTSTQWRYSIISTPAASIGVLFFGEYMGLEVGLWQGFTPPSLSRNNNYITNVAQNGSFIGRSIVSQAGAVKIGVEHMTFDFVENSWKPFINHIEKKSFFFSWNVANFPNDHSFAWSTDKKFTTSIQSHGRMKSTINARTISE